MESFSALISCFITCVLVVLFMNVSSYFAVRYSTDKEKNLNPDFKNMTLKEKLLNFMFRVSKTPYSASIYICTIVFISVFFERQ